MSCPEIIPMSVERGLRRAVMPFVYILCLAPAWAYASGETRVETLITTSAEYNDNILFSRSKIIEDTTLRIIPRLDMDYSTELLELESGLSGEVLRYREHDELDNEYLSADIEADYRPAERIGINAGGSVVNDTTLDTELDETGILIAREDRETMNAFGGITCNAGERSSVSAEYSFTRVDYDSEDYSGYKGDTISLTYFLRMKDMKDAFNLRPYYSRNDSDAYRVENAGIYAGWRREIDETWSVSASLGVRDTRTSYLLWGLFRLEEEKNGWLGELSLKKKGETWGMETGLSRELSYSVYGDPIESDRFFLELSRNFSERLSGSFYGTAARSESASSLSESLRRDSWHVRLSPSLRMRISKGLFLDAGYAYSHSNDRLAASRRGIDRNILRLSLSWGISN